MQRINAAKNTETANMAKPKRASALRESFRTDAGFRQAEEDLRLNIILANNVLELRLRANKSQADLAAAAGMKQPRIADIEAAKGNPSLVTIARLAHALNTTPDALLRDGAEEYVAASEMVVVMATAAPESAPFQDELLNSLYVGAPAPVFDVTQFDKKIRFLE
jgi:transcriptional regulator with XRE-family HTH domain